MTARADVDRARVRVEALGGRQGAQVRRERGEPCLGGFDHVHVLAEGVDPERAGEPSGAGGGEHVVHPGDVVAQRGRRPRTDEHRARVAHERNQRVGIGGEQLEVLGRDHVDRVERGERVVDQHDATTGGKGRSAISA